MDYLNDLKKQAEVARQEEEAQQTEARKDAENAKEIAEALKLTYRYLKEVVEALNAAKPEVSIQYEVEGFGALVGLTQENYCLDKGEIDGTRTIIFTFQCVSDNGKPRTFKVDGRNALQRQREYLWRHNLRFTDKVSADSVATFFLEPVVFVRLEFVPDFKVGKIKLVMTNMEILGETIRWIAPDRVSRETLDDLTGLILRKTTELERLAGGQISDEMRQRIQEGLRKEQEERERQDQVAAAQAAEEERLRKEQQLVNRVGRKVDSLGRCAFGYLKGGRNEEPVPDPEEGG